MGGKSVHSVIISPRRNHTGDLLLKSYFEKAGFKVKIVPNVGSVPGDSNLVINRNFGTDYKDCDLFSLEGAQTLNSLHSQKVCRDKLATLKLASSLGIPTGQFYSLESFLSKERTGKWALKTLRGMQGRGVFLGLSFKDVKERFSDEGDRRFMTQEQILGDEMRALRLGEKTLFFKKENGGNLYQGATFTLEKESALVGPIAEKLFEKLGLQFGAADFILNSGGPFLLDCNAYPGLKALAPYTDDIMSFLKSLEKRLNSKTCP